MPTRPCAAVPVLPPVLPDADALDACADELLQRLGAAQRPVLMVGVEIRRYGLEARVAELARRLRVPVVTSFMGRGLLSDTAAPPRGTYLGLAGDPEVSEQVEQSDALCLLGVIVSDTNFAVSARRIDLRHAILALEGRVTMGHHHYLDVPLPALVERLLARLGNAPAAPDRLAVPAAPDGRSGAAPDAHPATAPPGPTAAAAPAAAAADDAPVRPLDIAAALGRLFAAHGPMPLACDVGDCLFTALELTQGALIAPGYYAGMGYGVPAGLGLQAATGQRPVVLVGDGAFQMTGWELGNARRYGWDPIVLVFNNASWEMLRAFQPASRFNALGSWDFASMAAGMGGDGHCVRTRAELQAALETAHARRGRFQLLDIRIPPGAQSPTLERFVAAVKRLSMPG
jgi:indolepyruvate decarboxylase